MRRFRQEVYRQTVLRNSSISSIAAAEEQLPHAPGFRAKSFIFFEIRDNGAYAISEAQAQHNRMHERLRAFFVVEI